MDSPKKGARPNALPLRGGRKDVLNLNKANNMPKFGKNIKYMLNQWVKFYTSRRQEGPKEDFVIIIDAECQYFRTPMPAGTARGEQVASGNGGLF